MCIKQNNRLKPNDERDDDTHKKLPTQTHIKRSPYVYWNDLMLSIECLLMVQRRALYMESMLHH